MPKSFKYTIIYKTTILRFMLNGIYIARPFANIRMILCKPAKVVLKNIK